MHEEQNNAPVKTVQSNRQEANFPKLQEKEKQKKVISVILTAKKNEDS